jgi:antirestriction protein ArdC
LDVAWARFPAVSTHDKVSCWKIWRFDNNCAYYAQELDYVQMPPFEPFRDAQSYDATLAHELTHLDETRATSQPQLWPQELERSGLRAWGACCRDGLCFPLRLELHQEPREGNAAYIATWLEVLKNDNRAIFAASAHAQRQR